MSMNTVSSNYNGSHNRVTSSHAHQSGPKPGRQQSEVAPHSIPEDSEQERLPTSPTPPNPQHHSDHPLRDSLFPNHDFGALPTLYITNRTSSLSTYTPPPPPPPRSAKPIPRVVNAAQEDLHVGREAAVGFMLYREERAREMGSKSEAVGKGGLWGRVRRAGGMLWVGSRERRGGGWWVGRRGPRLVVG
ncbi:hypothetical protein P153DRAFT_383943 [Dothidotthia symphoricarpi CBS 119687]|uniref:Uncharacterized protein n=1 Tax=Dothidotthia symphoricarpi CBS 119687 TaxID=1392245 RepID=A0A6A6AII2_9PLEO|nr:uncharacterized protein P153DRAFT_383943 [Dothidotthia symphoricarpi CBS 119687]KAF2130717.1 hypothetical protein P153DRAFT_383943 [Dothidotthia symphoricarpi CBS 119687]